MKTSFWTTAFKQSFSEWSADNCTRLAAALAYYSIFAIAPLIMIAIAVAGIAFGEQAVRGQVQGTLSDTMGEEAASAIQSMLAGARDQTTGGITAAFGIIALLAGVTGLFAELKASLNLIWGIEPKPSNSIGYTIRTRLASFGLVLAIGFLLLVSLLLSAALSAAGGWLEEVLPLPAFVWQLVNLLLMFGVITLLFAAIFKVLPDAKIKWADVWIGAAITSLLFVIGKFLLGLYLGQEGAASAYGAAGALVLVLLWVYYSSLILLFGAEFTQVYARLTGSRIEPDEDAIAQEETTPEEAKRRQRKASSKSPGRTKGR
jgi:membrane protein